MLVTDPSKRASLAEIMNHPWLTKGYGGPPDNFLPPRLPLQLPLDSRVIEKMTGFDFGSTDYITRELTRVLESEEYQAAVRALDRKKKEEPSDADRKKSVFDFYKRRNSMSRDTLATLSSEGLHLGYDPVNAFSPLISVYYLVREKQEREYQEANPGALRMPISPGQQPLQMPDLPAPETAYTNANAYEMKGEAPTGGRTRPRARTHGEDEVTGEMEKLKVASPGAPPSPAIVTPPNDQPPAKRENAAVGLLRRLSTRRSKDPDRPRPQNPPPSLAVSSPNEATGAPPRKSFSVRKPKDREHPPPSLARVGGGSQVDQSNLLSPPGSKTGMLKGLARSTSVNSADMRRRLSRRVASEATPASREREREREPPATSGSDNSSIAMTKGRPGDAASDDQGASRNRGPASRTKSLGHARRESIQARRAQREQAMQSNVLEATDEEAIAEDTEHTPKESPNPEGMKPVYLKGLFSVSTTSNRPLTVIRADIIRVLKQLGVQYHEIKGGFSCKHSPSIDLSNEKKAGGESMPTSPAQGTTGSGTGHRRKISFGGFMGGDRDREEFRAQHTPQTPRSISKSKAAPDHSYPESEDSDESEGQEIPPIQPRPARQRAPGETSTHVRDDTGSNMALKFEILVVKVPLLSLHGIQFKKVDGGTWQYKNMAQTILGELRL